MFCTKCGSTLSDEVQFCSTCGQRSTSTASELRVDAERGQASTDTPATASLSPTPRPTKEADRVLEPANAGQQRLILKTRELSTWTKIGQNY